METKWLHNTVDGDETIYYKRRGGISVEHMIRPSKFNMKSSHFHQEYEIYLLLEGSRQFFFDNRAYLVCKGSLVLVDSNQIHMSHSVQDDAENTYERIILYINREKVCQYDEIFPELKLGDFLKYHYGIYALSVEQIRRAMQLFSILKKELNEPQKQSQTLVDLEIIRFFIDFWRANKPVSYLKDKNDLQKAGKYTIAYAVSDYISEHFCEQIKLDHLADEFFVSKYYLSRIFKKVAGIGISEYITVLRIQRAQMMLEETGYSVSEISDKVGFESVSYFGKIFRKHYNMTPAQYRKAISAYSGEKETAAYANGKESTVYAAEEELAADARERETQL